MELSDLEKIRVQKMQAMRQRGVEPYPTRANPTHSVQRAVEAFLKSETEGGELVQVTLAGRLRSMRPMGKVSFAHIEDGSGQVQLFFRLNEVGEEALQTLRDEFDLGDFIEASGVMFRTRTGEITLHVHAFHMLAKSHHPPAGCQR